MENVKETYKRSDHTLNSNATSHYRLMTIGIIVGLAGIMLRFAGSWALIDIAANVLFVIGIVICIKAVLNILR